MMIDYEDDQDEDHFVSKNHSMGTWEGNDDGFLAIMTITMMRVFIWWLWRWWWWWWWWWFVQNPEVSWLYFLLLSRTGGSGTHVGLISSLLHKAGREKSSWKRTRMSLCLYFDFNLFHGLSHKINCSFLNFVPYRTFPNSLTEAHHCLSFEVYKFDMQDSSTHRPPLPTQKRLFPPSPVKK